MDDDWASDGEEEGLGDLSDLPVIDIPPQQRHNPVPPHKSLHPPTSERPPPRQNAWTKPNQSHQVRAAAQQPPQPRPQHRRQNSFPASFGSKLDRFDSDPHSQQRRASNAPSITLYATNLPYETNEQAIADFFNENTINVFGIRLMRHSDTGNIKAALVTIAADHVTKALATDGKLFGGRTIYVKVDGTDGKRGSRDKDRGDRGLNKTSSFGSSFGSRVAPNGNSRSGTVWNDRGPGHSFDSQLTRRPSDNSREDRRSRAASHSTDPTIPTGPPPAGRKKLQLMPRTKPPPSLQADKRNAPASKAPQTAMPAPGRPEHDTSVQSKGGPAPRRVNSLGGERFSRSDSNDDKFDKVEKRDRGGRASGESASNWTNLKETNVSRPPPHPTKKEDDSKRPVLLNTFAALESNDSDV
ncbi:unnamed protein product [Agarophyton chilense]